MAGIDTRRAASRLKKLRTSDGRRAVGLGLALRARRASWAVLSRLPPSLGEPAWMLLNKAMLTIGWGDVVPAAAFEQFLSAQLEALGRDAGRSMSDGDREGDPEGDYVEFGVYVGTSMGAAVRAFDKAGLRGSRFVGFDSFAGLPAGSESEGWRSGDFRASRALAEWNLSRQGVLPRVNLVEGWFDQTCTSATIERYRLEKVLVAMIDCDTYTSSKIAVDFVAPLLAPRCLLVFDDWYTANPDGSQLEGQRKVFEELLARSPNLRAEDAGRPGFHGQAFRLSSAA
jgi:O-methyltransferase